MFPDFYLTFRTFSINSYIYLFYNQQAEEIVDSIKKYENVLSNLPNVIVAGSYHSLASWAGLFWSCKSENINRTSNSFPEFLVMPVFFVWLSKVSSIL